MATNYLISANFTGSSTGVAFYWPIGSETAYYMNNTAYDVLYWPNATADSTVTVTAGNYTPAGDLTNIATMNVTDQNYSLGTQTAAFYNTSITLAEGKTFTNSGTFVVKDADANGTTGIEINVGSKTAGEPAVAVATFINEDGAIFNIQNKVNFHGTATNDDIGANTAIVSNAGTINIAGGSKGSTVVAEVSGEGDITLSGKLYDTGIIGDNDFYTVTNTAMYGAGAYLQGKSLTVDHTMTLAATNNNILDFATATVNGMIIVNKGANLNLPSVSGTGNIVVQPATGTDPVALSGSKVIGTVPVIFDKGLLYGTNEITTVRTKKSGSVLEIAAGAEGEGNTNSLTATTLTLVAGSQFKANGYAIVDVDNVNMADTASFTVSGAANTLKIGKMVEPNEGEAELVGGLIGTITLGTGAVLKDSAIYAKNDTAKVSVVATGSQPASISGDNVISADVDVTSGKLALVEAASLTAVDTLTIKDGASLSASRSSTLEANEIVIGKKGSNGVGLVANSIDITADSVTVDENGQFRVYGTYGTGTTLDIDELTGTLEIGDTNNNALIDNSSVGGANGTVLLGQYAERNVAFTGVNNFTAKLVNKAVLAKVAKAAELNVSDLVNESAITLNAGVAAVPAVEADPNAVPPVEAAAAIPQVDGGKLSGTILNKGAITVENLATLTGTITNGVAAVPAVEADPNAEPPVAATDPIPAVEGEINVAGALTGTINNVAGTITVNAGGLVDATITNDATIIVEAGGNLLGSVTNTNGTITLAGTVGGADADSLTITGGIVNVAKAATLKNITIKGSVVSGGNEYSYADGEVKLFNGSTYTNYLVTAREGGVITIDASSKISGYQVNNCAINLDTTQAVSAIAAGGVLVSGTLDNVTLKVDGKNVADSKEITLTVAGETDNYTVMKLDNGVFLTKGQSQGNVYVLQGDADWNAAADGTEVTYTYTPAGETEEVTLTLIKGFNAFTSFTSALDAVSDRTGNTNIYLLSDVSEELTANYTATLNGNINVESKPAAPVGEAPVQNFRITLDKNFTLTQPENVSAAFTVDDSVVSFTAPVADFRAISALDFNGTFNGTTFRAPRNGAWEDSDTEINGSVNITTDAYFYAGDVSVLGTITASGASGNIYIYAGGSEPFGGKSAADSKLVVDIDGSAVNGGSRFSATDYQVTATNTMVVTGGTVNTTATFIKAGQLSVTDEYARGADYEVKIDINSDSTQWDISTGFIRYFGYDNLVNGVGFTRSTFASGSSIDFTFENESTLNVTGDFINVPYWTDQFGQDSIAVRTDGAPVIALSLDKSTMTVGSTVGSKFENLGEITAKNGSTISVTGTLNNLAVDGTASVMVMLEEAFETATEIKVSFTTVKDNEPVVVEKAFTVAAGQKSLYVAIPQEGLNLEAGDYAVEAYRMVEEEKQSLFTDDVTIAYPTMAGEISLDASTLNVNTLSNYGTIEATNGATIKLTQWGDNYGTIEVKTGATFDGRVNVFEGASVTVNGAILKGNNVGFDLQSGKGALSISGTNTLEFNLFNGTANLDGVTTTDASITGNGFDKAELALTGSNTFTGETATALNNLTVTVAESSSVAFNKKLTGNAALVNDGTVDFNGDQAQSIGAVTNNGTMSVKTSGSSVALTAASIANGTADTFKTDGSVDVAGKAGSLTVSGKMKSTGAITNNGTAAAASTITVSGTLTATGGITNGYEVAANAKDSVKNAAKNATITVTGTLEATTASTTVTNYGTFEVNAGTFSAKAVANSGTFNVLGSSKLTIDSLSGNSILLKNGADIKNDSKVVGGDLKVESGSVTISGLKSGTTATLTNSGTVIFQSNASTIGNVTNKANGVVNVNVGGAKTVSIAAFTNESSSSATVFADSAITAGSLTNKGTFTLASKNGNKIAKANISGDIKNRKGTITLNNGSILNGAAVYNGKEGSDTSNAAATLDILSGATLNATTIENKGYNNSALAKINVAGTLNASTITNNANAQIEISGTATASGKVSNNDSTATISVVSGGKLNAKAGVDVVNGTVSVAGTLEAVNVSGSSPSTTTYQAVTIGDQTNGSTAELNISGTATTGAVTLKGAAGDKLAQVIVSGELTATGIENNANGKVTISGTATVNGNVINNNLFDITGTATATGMIVNRGTLTATGATLGGGALSNDTAGSATVTNSTVNMNIINNGSATFTNSILGGNEAGISVSNAEGKTLTVKGASTLNIATLTGTLTLDGATIADGAKVAGTGTVLVSGTANSTIGKGSFGALAVASGASLTIDAHNPTAEGPVLTINGDFANEGSLTINAADVAFAEGVEQIKVIGVTGTFTTGSVIEVKGSTDPLTVIVGADGLYLRKTEGPSPYKVETIYVNTAWKGYAPGDAVSYKGLNLIFGANAFASVEGLAYDPATKNVVFASSNGNYGAFNLTNSNVSKVEVDGAGATKITTLALPTASNTVVDMKGQTVSVTGAAASETAATTTLNGATLDLFAAKADLGAIQDVGTIKTSWDAKLSFTGFNTNDAEANQRLIIDVATFCGNGNTVVTASSNTNKYGGAQIVAGDKVVEDGVTKYFKKSGNNFITNDEARYVTYVSQVQTGIGYDNQIDKATGYYWTVGTTTTYHAEVVEILDGTYTASTYLNAVKGQKVIIQDGVTFSSAAPLFGGVLQKTLGTKITQETEIDDAADPTNINLQINGGSFNQVLVAGDRINLSKETTLNKGVFTRHGETNLTINGGTFESWVVGGQYLQPSTTAISQIGGTNLTINGGTFKNTVYGGNLTSNKSYSAFATVTGNVNITINAGKNAIDISSLTVGSYGAGVVEGNTKLTLTGDLTAEDAASFKIGNIWGGSGSDSFDMTSREYHGSVEGQKILSFEGFKGTLDATIGDFSKVEIDAMSSVELNSKAKNLSDVNEWDVEIIGKDGTSFSGAFENNMNGDTLKLTISDMVKDDTWTVFGAGITLLNTENLQVFFGETKGAYDITTNTWSTNEYKATYQESTGMILTKIA